jgi:CHAT domain-containing protein
VPAIDEEARALKAIYGEALRELDAPTLGPALTRGDVTGSLLHIAAHGAFQPHNPMFSGLSFGSCVLTAHDISSLALNLEVVTLGGCETGRSGRIEGEALLGIDQAFLGAGARAVLSSLWVVDDQVAGELMARTHGELAKGRTIGAALATAQRAALKRDPHPFQWAPFTLSGDPDARILNSGPTHLDQ